MFRLITGKAGAGKTGKIFDEISLAVREGREGSYLLVPELFSYEAQRELSCACGDSLSLYAHVTTFTDLSRQISNEVGGSAVPYMDEGGRLLCMSLALRELQKSDALSYFKNNAHRSEIAQMMLGAVDKMKESAITPKMLLEIMPNLDESLSSKISDLVCVAEKFDEIVFEGHADPADRLRILSQQIENSSLSDKNTFYLDGFTGFTESEYAVLYALLRKGVNMVVCLTLDRFDDENPEFALPRSTAHRLKRMAEELSCDFIAERYTHYSDEPEHSFICCSGMMEECEYAAVKTLELIRDENCRFRDIAIAVRGFEEYRSTLESTFEKFSIPLYTARKQPIASKPLSMFISSAYETILNGFAVDDVISLLGTGLTDLDYSSCDALSEYLFKWNLREGHWRQEKDWYLHPDGYGREYTDDTYTALNKINSYRRVVGNALVRFADASNEAETVRDHAFALAELIEKMHVSKHMNDSEAQLWDICISALEQMEAILGDKAMETDEFYRLFMLMLSKYDTGSIPDSVDSVSAGDFDRMRRRHIKHLIVLGASDERLPASGLEDSLFSDDELEMLQNNNLEFGGNLEDNLYREFSLIYNCFSLPEKKLFFAYSGRPSYLIHAGDDVAKYIPVKPPEIKPVERGGLSRQSVRSLYGDKLFISASRADKFYSCKYSYFCQYGLKAKPFKSANFSYSEIGTFVHYVLENVAKEVAASGGFKNTDDDTVIAITRKHIDEYVLNQLGGMQDKNERFAFLFKRIENDTFRIVLDTAAELRKSDFVPCEFELDFSGSDNYSYLPLNDGNDSLNLTGIADRVDVWENDGKKFMRVVDYKTGIKKFSLSDIWYGNGMQMLLYLYALACEEDIVPAGVMYVPARSKYISLKSAPEGDTLQKERTNAMRRSGIVLDSYGVPDAWENGEDKIYEPRKPVMNLEQFDLLTQHMTGRLSQMAESIRNGDICADPYRKGSEDTACRNCDFFLSCGFADGENGENIRNLKKLSPEDVWDRIREEVNADE